jgi:hypothetical protein
MTNTFLTLIVPASQQQLAQLIAVTLDPSGGHGMWTTGLSTDGNPPATYYISTGYVGGGWLNLVPVAEWAQDEEGNWIKISETPGNAAAVVAGCVAKEVSVTLDEVEALFATSDVSQQGPFVAIARLNLRVTQEPEPSNPTPHASEEGQFQEDNL